MVTAYSRKLERCSAAVTSNTAWSPLMLTYKVICKPYVKVQKPFKHLDVLHGSLYQDRLILMYYMVLCIKIDLEEILGLAC
jgi:hypothetical protein